MASPNSDTIKRVTTDRISIEKDDDDSEEIERCDTDCSRKDGNFVGAGTSQLNYQAIESCSIASTNSLMSTVTGFPSKYSATKVRIVVILISALSSGVVTTQSVVSQYLLHRWSDNGGNWHHRHFHRQNGTGNDTGLELIENHHWTKPEDDIQAKVSLATMHYSMTTNILALLSCLIFGALVDIIGRKIALAISLLGTTCQHIVIICIIRFKLDPNLFFLGYALDGLGGSIYVVVITTYAITADISQQKSSRILGIVGLGSIGGAMTALCNVIVGVIIKKLGYVAAISFIIAPLAISLLVTVLFLTETLPVPKQKVSLRRVWNYTARIVSLFCRDGDRKTRWSLVLSLAIFFTGVLSNVGVGSIDTLYQKHEPLKWNAAQLGYYAAFRGSGTSVLAFIYFCIWRWCGCASDEVSSMVGMLFLAASLVLEAFVTNTWQMYMGVIFSSVALIEVSCTLTGSIIYNQIYAATVGVLPGFVYLIMAGIAIITFFLYIPFFYFYNRRPNSYEKIAQDT